jgi:hypothetical protein
MRTRAVRAAAVLTLVALVGCGDGNTEPRAEPSNPATADVDAVPTPTTEPEPTPTETPIGETSQRGNLIKDVGETAYMYHLDTGENWFEFQITDIEVGGTCTSESAVPAENGQFLILSIKASTGTNWPEELQGVTLDFNPFDFSAIGPDGVTEANLATDAVFGCVAEGDLLPDAFGPGENVVGKVALDTKSESGTLVYKPWYGGGGGWEWPF